MFTRIPVAAGLILATVVAAAPAAAQYRVERQLALRQGGTFALDSDVGSVTITGDATNGAAVTIESRDNEFQRRYDVQFDERADGVTVRVKRRTSGITDLFRGGWRGNTRITIRVPRATSTTISTAGGSIEASRLGNIRLRTSGGGITVGDVAGRADLNTSGGSITATGIGGDLTAETSGGGIRIADARGTVRADTSGGSIDVDSPAGDLQASTSGGGIRVRNARGRVDAHTSGGSVQVGFAGGNARGGDLSTSGGGITAAVDPSAKLSIDASSSGGGVSADIPITVTGSMSRRSIKGDMNGGGALLRMRTSGGGVRITGVSQN